VQEAHTEILEDFKFGQLSALLYRNLFKYLNKEDQKKVIKQSNSFEIWMK
jgi:hypothetical protein